MKLPCQAFELRRHIDDLVYKFELDSDSDDHIAYKRTDGDYWIIRHEHFGWIAGSRDSDDVSGRPWNTLPSDQTEHPPEGIWVSRKRSKSYVYDLIYI